MNGITKDQGINALREIRGLLDVASINAVDTRSTIAAQAAHIASLKKELETSDMAIESLQDMCDEHEAENKELKRLNSIMFLRLEAHAKARYHGGKLTNRQAEFMVGLLNNEGAHAKQVRTNRIATAIRNRIEDNHPAIAIMLCAALMEETSNDNDDRIGGTNAKARSIGDTKTARSLGTPYIGE